jgi:hypothetical protein
MGVFARDENQLMPEFLFKWFGNLDLASMQDGTSVPQINKGNLAGGLSVDHSSSFT